MTNFNLDFAVEMNTSDMKNIEGGVWWQIAGAAVAGGLAIIGGAYQAGQAVGEAIYNATH